MLALVSTLTGPPVNHYQPRDESDLPMLSSIITTINPPSPSVQELARKHRELQLGKIIIVGDQKGPSTYELDSTYLLDIDVQDDIFPTISRKLPRNNYARKNLGYLFAIREGASYLYETDDDNSPNASWAPRASDLINHKEVATQPGWVNVYSYFSSEHIWPRGLPLSEVTTPPIALNEAIGHAFSPIQQGLANKSPDVDAIWRLTLDRPFEFEPSITDTVYLPKGVWSPFNSQSTWWWPVAYSLMYLPSYCSFRMCDIWRSFVAQRCLWEFGAGISFHPPEVEQDRNEHDLDKDFEDEVPGYLLNNKIVKSLGSLNLKKGVDNVSDNLKACYRSLVDEAIFPSEELTLLDLWLEELHSA